MKYILTILFLVITQLSYGQYHEQKPKHHHHDNIDHDYEDDDEDEDDGCLPVTLTEFKAKANTNSVKITWTTETETDNDYFTLFHSPDGYEYYYLATINGAGTINYSLKYYFVDTEPYSGVNYYVLTQTDINGKREMFPPTSAYFIKYDDGQDMWEYYNILGQRIK